MKLPLLLANPEKPKLSIETGGGQRLAVRREGDCMNAITVAAECLHQLAIAGLPELYCFVITCGCQSLAIWTEGEALNIITMRPRFFP